MKKSSPVPIIIYNADAAPPSVALLKKIGEKPTVVMNKSGTIDVEFKFALKDILEGHRMIKLKTGSVVVDPEQLRALAPNGNTSLRGYVTELRCVGRYNDSPVTLIFGAPDVTRASFNVVKELSEESKLPDIIRKKMESDDPMLTTLCPPAASFPEGSRLAEAVSISRERDGVLLFVESNDGIMSQNPKAMLIIDECASATKQSIENTFVRDTHQKAVHTPGNSLLSAIVRCYPSSKVRLVWDDQKKAPFDVSNDVMFFIPAGVANHAIAEISRRKEVVKQLLMAVENIAFAIQVSPMHGSWEYDITTDTYVNRDDDSRYDATAEFSMRARIALTMRYTLPKADRCALAQDSQFYPMPVWPKSGLHNNEPRPGVKPFPGTLYDQVAERLESIAGEQGRKRRAAIQQAVEEGNESSSSQAASSVAVDDE